MGALTALKIARAQKFFQKGIDFFILCGIIKSSRERK